MLAGALCVALVLMCVVYVAAWIRFTGTPVARPVIPRDVQRVGEGESLTLVVVGDSTAIAQGGLYSEGYAAAAAAYLATSRRVVWQNVAVSGARAADVAGGQLEQALRLQPDVVVIGVGANDVTHGTSVEAVTRSLRHIIDALQTAQPDVRIILTGAPDMGSPPRIPQPLRWLAGKRTVSLNTVLAGQLTDGQRVIWAPIADRTGPAFRADAGLFAADKFHPNTEGYRLWNEVIIDALKRAGL